MGERTEKQNKQTKKMWITVIAFIVGYLIIKGAFTYYNAHHYSQAYKDNFISACTEQGAEYSYCSCALGYVQEHYTAQEAVEMEKTGDYPVDAVVSRCS